ncbi:MAG: sulfatase-like hydrolase/transferase [Ignavibacteriales bacterium]|nr:sulfatase-like hydrolase/transferase [Ignavibacteriales bacterium]
MKLWKRIPQHVQFLLTVYALGMLCFSLIRLVLVGVNLRQLQGIPADVVISAFVMGLRFDTVVSGYILILPFLYFTLLALLRIRNRITVLVGVASVAVLYSLSLLICVADVPYFNYFNSRLTINVLSWIDSPGFMMKMLMQDTTYYPFVLGFLLLLAAYWYALRKLVKNFIDPVAETTSYQVGRGAIAGWWIFLTLLLFIGIRGRVSEKSPIRWGTAFFSTYQFPNQMGLNPVFTFLESWLESLKPENIDIAFISESDAIRTVRREFKIQDTVFRSPIARTARTGGQPERHNVVIVLLESMASWKLSHFGNPDSLTPVLDSLIGCSLSFDNFYSAGIHTYNGVYSTLFGFPGILSRHPMKGARSMQSFTGIGGELRSHGYATAFVCTHDEQFDNMAGFLSANGYECIISQKDYPSGEIKSTLGVPDHVMFEKGIETINDMQKTGKPFFAAMLSASDHGPYIVPSGIPFTPRHSDVHKAIIEYVDWSIGHFLRLAAQQPWYANTIFVFLADHGGVHDSRYVLPLEYLHIPCIIHAPSIIKTPVQIAGLAGQIDLYPTIMGLLHQPFVNNTMGVDVLNDSRRFIFFNADDKLGCVDQEYLWISKLGDKELLYRYRDAGAVECLSIHQNLSERMKAYTYSMLEVTQSMLRTKTMGFPVGKGNQGAANR